MRGEINGTLLGGNYFVQNADLTAALPVSGVGSVSSIRDVDKNGFILNSDFIVIRLGIIGGLALRNITIPATGSGAALPRVSSIGIAAPPVQSFEQASMIMSSSQRSIQATNETDLGNIATGSRTVLGCVVNSISGTMVTSKPSKVADFGEGVENTVGRIQIVDDFFADLERPFKRRN